MPRRPAYLLKKIPLWLIPQIVREEVIRAGEELYRIVVDKRGRHSFNISVHTRLVKRELRPVVERAGEGRP